MAAKRITKPERLLHRLCSSLFCVQKSPRADAPVKKQFRKIGRFSGIANKK
ncbi:hypothetical protein FAEPRAM212_01317 [Faecalibacterium prausnitzii M21/2]|uniref:Uncharacterized protein n=1 Tax=Faecalibacterium prausnitzii M21/2 TaxID=411485 RepID=A8SAC0_9FIRM|nr:hypothetical protein FAEPRAM212_01317 [Faecalibacterium prausnitzii M21/2]